MDYYPEEPRLGVVYELLDMSRVDRITVKLRVSLDAPTVESVSEDWPTANHQEREVYDMFGVVFDGHPDLRRILMPEDYEGHPPAARLPDRRRAGDLHLRRGQMAGVARMTPARETSSSTAGASRASRSRPVDEQLESEPDGHGPRTQELLTLNFGPHHPATHGVLRLLVTLQGEIVRDIKPIVGYVHTGIEKTAEDKAYWKVIPIVERMDYLSYYFNAMAFCGAVENLLGVEVPPRAQYLRVIHLELNRIASHLVWMGTSGLELGAMSMLMYCFRERDTILDLFEMSSGQRMHTRYFQVGGVIEDIRRRASRRSCVSS